LRRFGLAADKGDCDGDAEGGDDDGVNADDQADDYMCSDADVEKTKDCNLKSRRKYQRSSYIPPRNSVLWKKMEMFKETVKDHSISNSSKDKYLWRDNNQADPVAAFNKKPEEFYLSNFHPFVWAPTKQFGLQVDLKQMKCAECKKCSLKLHQYAWRPMFQFEKIIWVLHHRIECQEKGCKKTFASIDPRFLSQLPTKIVERFPFVTTIGGPGIHQSMIFHFVHLLTKGIMYGTYAKSINELHNIRYACDTISYYDCAADYTQGKENNNLEPGIMEVSIHHVQLLK